MRFIVASINAIGITGGSVNKGWFVGRHTGREGWDAAESWIPLASSGPRKKADGDSRVHDNGTTPCEKRL